MEFKNPARPVGKKELLEGMNFSGHLASLSARGEIMLVTSKKYFPAYHITALIPNDKAYTGAFAASTARYKVFFHSGLRATPLGPVADCPYL